jgi:hypothetical protein
MHLNSLAMRTVICAAALAGGALMAVPAAFADASTGSATQAPAKPLVGRTSALIPNPYLDANTELAHRALSANRLFDPTRPGRFFAMAVTSPGDDGDSHRFIAIIDHHAKFYELHLRLTKAGKATRLDAATYLRTEIETEGLFGMDGPLDIQSAVQEVIKRVVQEVQKGPYPTGTDYEYALDSALRVLEGRFSWATLVQSPGAGALVHASLNKLRRPVSLQSLLTAAAARKSARRYIQIKSFSAGGNEAKIAALVSTTPLFPSDTGYDCDRWPQLTFKRERGFWFLVNSFDPIC